MEEPAYRHEAPRASVWSRPMRRLLACAIALLLPAPAAAAPVAPLGRHATDHVVWAGDRLVAWDERQVETLEADGRFVQRFAVAPPEGQLADIDSLAVNGGRIAFVTFGSTLEGEGGSDLAWTSLRAGPLAGPFGVVAGEERARPGPERRHGPQAAAVADGGVAFVERTAQGSRLVWLPDGGGRVELGAAPDALHARGRYLALSRGGAIEVLDTTAGPGLAYRVDLAARPLVATDGSVAALTPEGELHTASPSAPAPVRRVEGVKALLGFGEGRVYFMVARGPYLHEARAADLGSGAQWPITPALPDHANGSSSVAADGSRLAFTDDMTGCVYAGDLPDAAPLGWPSGRGCRPRMHNDVGDAVPRSGRFPATLACPGATGDLCSGQLQIRTRRRGARRWRVRSRRRFLLAGGQTQDFILRVRRQRASRHQLRIRMAAGSTATGGDVRDLFF